MPKKRMKILITNRGPGHITYRKMSQKPADELRKMGHEVILNKGTKDFGQDLTIILGFSVSWEDVKDLPGKKIWWSHGANWSTHSNYKEDNTVVWDLIRNCDAVCYQSEFAKHMAQKYLEHDREGPIILNAAPVNFTENQPKAENSINIGTAAIFREWKRLPEMERIIDKINKQSEWRKFHLWVYGRGVEEKTYGDSQYIHYLGLENDFPKYKECHFYMQISFNDFSPATVGEAMAYGLPCIIGNSGGSPDIVGKSGIIVNIDPYIDYPINTYTQIPEIDDSKVITAMNDMTNNLEGFRSKVRDQVLSLANSKISAQKLIDLYETL